MGLRRYAEAIALFLASMRQCGEHHVTVHNCGICLFHLARFGAAAEAFKKALKITPTYAEASHWLARAEERARGGADPPPPPPRAV
jgi:Tfp pilus assembly protein PilF